MLPLKLAFLIVVSLLLGVEFADAASSQAKQVGVSTCQHI